MQRSRDFMSNMAASMNYSDGGDVSSNDTIHAMRNGTMKLSAVDATTSCAAKNNGEHDVGDVVAPQSNDTPTEAGEESGTQKNGEISSPHDASKKSRPTKFKFQYQPREFERNYYDRLFEFAKTNSPDDAIVPPKDAAKLFVTSGIPSERLRVIWNMAVLPARPYAPGTKPPPAMNVGQFRVAVRLIQLVQNKITAKDEWLRVSKEVTMAPACFSGVSGVLVPLPWNGDGGRMNTDFSASTANNAKHDDPSDDKDSRASNLPIDNYPAKPYAPEKEETIGTTACGRIVQPRRRSTDPIHTASEGSTSTLPNIPSSNVNDIQRPSIITPCDSPQINWPNDDYFLSQSDSDLYRDIFLKNCITDEVSQPNQRIHINTAICLFEESGLRRDILRQIWNVVVTDPEFEFLNDVEFILISHLISCVTDGGHAVPTALPTPLRTWKVARLAELNASQNEFSVTTPPFPADDDASTANASRIILGERANIDQKRLKQMEQEISLLKQSVLKLRLDVHELKDALNEINTTRRKSGSTNSSDDIPNVDVEMFWKDKKNVRASPKSEVSTTSAPSIKNRPLTSIRGVSQNIPPVHPVQSSAENRSRTLYQPKLHRAMPQSRGQVTSSETMKGDQQFSCVDDGSGATSRNTQTHQQIRSNGDATSAASSRISQRSYREPTFQPESCSITSRHVQKQASLNRLESSRHVTRSKSGETKIYKTEEPPSTAVVDLPPL